MADYRSFFDRDYIAAFDLQGKDRTVTIERVVGKELTANGGRKSKKPVIYFKGAEKGFALNKTNGKVIAALYGPNTEQWAGKKITLYPTKTTFGSEEMDCIRVRPTVQAKAAEMPAEPVSAATLGDDPLGDDDATKGVPS
jgi:hypothetical protein